MVIDGIAIFSTAPSGSLWIKDYKVIYLGFPMQRTMLRCLLTRNCCWFVCFPRELWVWEKIHLTFAKKWEIKNLPWDHEKGSETVWHTMKLWELRGLEVPCKIWRKTELCFWKKYEKFGKFSPEHLEVSKLGL